MEHQADTSVVIVEFKNQFQPYHNTVKSPLQMSVVLKLGKYAVNIDVLNKIAVALGSELRMIEKE